MLGAQQDASCHQSVTYPPKKSLGAHQFSRWHQNARWPSKEMPSAHQNKCHVPTKIKAGCLSRWLLSTTTRHAQQTKCWLPTEMPGAHQSKCCVVKEMPVWPPGENQGVSIKVAIKIKTRCPPICQLATKIYAGCPSICQVATKTPCARQN